MGGEAEAEEALAAAVAAYDDGRGVWPTMTVADRIACMQAFTNQMIAAGRRSCSLIMWEIGKSQADSREGVRPHGRLHPRHHRGAEGARQQQLALPRSSRARSARSAARRSGVVLCMGPYNYPLNETFATLIPALIMGNTMVFKPPRYGALLFHPLLEAFRSAFPKGVINTVYGRGSVIVPRLLDSGQGQRADPHRLEQGRGSSEEAASQGAPPAGHPRPRRQERRHRPAGRRHRARRQGMPARARCRSTASAARRSRC